MWSGCPEIENRIRDVQVHVVEKKHFRLSLRTAERGGMVSQMNLLICDTNHFPQHLKTGEGAENR
jgi:hypothetical protein